MHYVDVGDVGSSFLSFTLDIQIVGFFIFYMAHYRYIGTVAKRIFFVEGILTNPGSLVKDLIPLHTSRMLKQLMRLEASHIML